jgi:hypothetical protein
MYASRDLSPRQEELAREARQRLVNGQKLNAHQKAAWDKYVYAKGVADTIAWLAKVPFHEYVAWTGRSAGEVEKQLAELGITFDPLDGVNVLQLAEKVHDCLDRVQGGRSRAGFSGGIAPR